MPKALEKVKDALVSKGKSESSAYAIATAQYKKTHPSYGKKSKKGKK